MKVHIRDASVETATVNGRNGAFQAHRQAGWVDLPSGERRKVRLRIKDGKGYAVGSYSVKDESFTVNQYGDLELGNLELAPDIASNVGNARVAG
jgi:hypothetical protein